MTHPTTNSIANIISCLAGIAICCLVASRFAASASPMDRRFVVGQQLEPIAGVPFDQSPNTVLVFVRSTCQFCTNSMGFYRSLAERAPASNFRLVVVSVEHPDVTRAYLKKHAVSPTAVAQAAASHPGGRTTPTLVVIDQRGVIRRFWSGQLDDARQHEVLESLHVGTVAERRH
jgi:peroxiredoxin